MACKLRCPNCKTMCKESGDISKSANGTYRVTETEKGNILTCSKCGAKNEVGKWQ